MASSRAAKGEGQFSPTCPTKAVAIGKDKATYDGEENLGDSFAQAVECDHVTYGPTPSRNLIVCIDGTANQFGIKVCFIRTSRFSHSFLNLWPRTPMSSRLTTWSRRNRGTCSLLSTTVVLARTFARRCYRGGTIGNGFTIRLTWLSLGTN
jgi:hypothetical protein